MDNRKSDIMVAERFGISDMPGLFRKSINIGDTEMGILIADEQVKKTLPPGEHKIGTNYEWAKKIIRIRNEAFTVRLDFFAMEAGDGEPVDGFLLMKVRLNSPEVFYRSLLPERNILYASDIGNSIAMALKDIVQTKAQQYQSEVLCHDSLAAKQITSELSDALEALAAERGLALQQVESFAFRVSEGDDILFEEMEKIRGRMESAGKQTKEVADQVTGLLLGRGLISSQEADDIRTAFITDPEKQGESVLTLMNKAVIRLENRMAERARNLMDRVAELESEVAKAKATPVPAGLIEWVKKDGLKTDELVRRHITRVLANSIADIKEVKLEVYQKGQKDMADSLSKLEDTTDLFCTEVKGAAYGSRAVSEMKESAFGRLLQKLKFETPADKRMVARLIRFEDTVFRKAEKYIASIEQMRQAHRTNGDLKKSIDDSKESLRGLKKQFAERESILEGFVRRSQAG